MKARSLVTLCAAITADGKLNPSAPSSSTGAEWLGSQPGDVILSAVGRADPTARLRALWSQADTQRVLCFGGPPLFRRLFERELVAEVYLLVRPTIDGRRGAATLSGVPGEFFPGSVRCRLLKMEVRGQECLLHYRVLRARAKRSVTA